MVILYYQWRQFNLKQNNKIYIPSKPFQNLKQCKITEQTQLAYDHARKVWEILTKKNDFISQLINIKIIVNSIQFRIDWSLMLDGSLNSIDTFFSPRSHFSRQLSENVRVTRKTRDCKIEIETAGDFLFFCLCHFL